MGATFLQETEAAIVMFDLRGFSKMAATLAPLELGIALQAFYEHCEKIVVGRQGKIVKFLGDAVLAVWLRESGAHVRLAMDALADGTKDTGGLDYSIALSTGPILAGHIGTESMKAYDILGEPVNIVVKLTTVATLRGARHLMTTSIAERPSVEVEGVEIGGRAFRLFRLA